MAELDEDMKEEIYNAFSDGTPIKDIMKEYKISPKQWKQIKTEFEGGETEPDEAIDVQQKIEKAAEKSAVDIAVSTTKETAKDIQQTKYNIGDSVYGLLFRANLNNDQMLEFVAKSITFFIQEYDNVENLKLQNEKYNEVLTAMSEVFDDRKQTLELIKDYQKECIINSVLPDKEYVLGLLKSTLIAE